ncbi:YaaL family protein [Planococcus sp. APC 3906]|uniref:YaaL family protein n=1 Tax=Planococcus TaxID=1372 RepID=UPI0025B4CB77|nr:YaaL family protein [Planococcus sp. APC 3906]MDN3451765.1 YaaL family protein [Planococcus sp. APC 3906]
MFFKRGKLRREFDEQLIQQFLDTKQDLVKAQTFQALSADYDQRSEAECKICECKNLYLLKEARIRNVSMK